jgi:hypothetical protein
VFDLPTRLHRSPYWAAVVIAALLAVAVGAGVAISRAIDGDTGPTASAAGEQLTARSLAIAVEGLCSVRADFESGDVEAARAVFYDKSHLFLHQLAAAVEVEDRNRATSLLIAKYRVEDLVAASDGSAIGADPETPSSVTTQLLHEVAAAASVLGLSAPDC